MWHMSNSCIIFLYSDCHCKRPLSFLVWLCVGIRLWICVFLSCFLRLFHIFFLFFSKHKSNDRRKESFPLLINLECSKYEPWEREEKSLSSKSFWWPFLYSHCSTSTHSTHKFYLPGVPKLTLYIYRAIRIGKN